MSHTEDEGNPRFQLRAYTTANPVRVAAIMLDIHGGNLMVSRDSIACAWGMRWPRHVPMTGRKSIRGRIGWSLPMLRAAGICHQDGDHLIIDDHGLMEMAASNLAAITDQDGVALPPSRWRFEPAVPPELHELSAALEATRVLSAIGEARDGGQSAHPARGHPRHRG